MQSVATASNVQSLENLEEGSCVDVLNASTGKWELGIIERFSDFRTEVEVTLPSGESRHRKLCHRLHDTA